MSDATSKVERNGAAVPMDHEYDGISEYDNPLPRWWVWLFWASIAFAIGYFFHYNLSGKGQGRIADLEQDVRIANEIAMKAAAKETVSEDSLAKLLDNAASQAAGAAIFAARCQSCHAEQGKGLIGPNLTDAYFLHGKGKLMDIFETVSNGVLAKGMPAWNKQLAPMELRNVVAYVGNLRGKNLPGKEPQGEPIGSAAKASPTSEPASDNPIVGAAGGPSKTSHAGLLPPANLTLPQPASSGPMGVAAPAVSTK